jgi:hypothetical protein
MAHERRAGLRGRRPVKPPDQRFKIQYLGSYLKQPLPPPQYPVDVTGGITEWDMLGNGPDPTCTTHPNGVGDCTFAGRQHYKMAKAKAYDLTEAWESSNDLVAEYLAYDNGQDRGANIADLLLSWYKAGKIVAFAPVDHSSRTECDSAMAAFHGLYVGVNLTPNCDQLFEQQQPWTLDGEQPDPNEGHCIVKVKADTGSDGWVTWGALQPSTVAWSTACLDEAWVVITAEDVSATTNIDIAQLRSDIDALGGTGG